MTDKVSDEVITETTVPVQHVRIVLGQSFDAARQAFESIIPKLNPDGIARLSDGDVEGGRRLLEQAAELSIFQHRDHGSVLQIAGQTRRALQYDVGNPLTASKMTRHQLSAALYAPFRVLLYEDSQGRAVFEYDRPSSLFGQFGDDEVLAVARDLDVAIAAALCRVQLVVEDNPVRRPTWCRRFMARRRDDSFRRRAPRM